MTTLPDPPSEFSKGGIVPGSTWVRLIPECSPDGMGRTDVVFADECFIRPPEMECVRRDEYHAAFPGAVRAASRAGGWHCPLNDPEAAEGDL